MKGNSNTQPNQFEKSNGKTQFRYNIVETVRTNDDETTIPTWNYEYIDVDATDKDTLIRALMKDKYETSDEIALINNKFKGDTKGASDYAEYQAYRDVVKDIIIEPSTPTAEEVDEKRKIDIAAEIALVYSVADELSIHRRLLQGTLKLTDAECVEWIGVIDAAKLKYQKV